MSVDCADTLQVKNLIKIALAHSVSEINAFYAEIQDGCQKLRENEFWENLVVDCMDNLWVKNFFEITLARFYAEIQDGHKKWRGNDFYSRYPACQKFRSSSHRFRDKCLLCFQH